MKKHFLFLSAALLLAGAASCSKNADSPLAPAEKADIPSGRISVQVGIPDEEAKALANSSSVKDFQINSVQVFVFDNAAMAGNGTEKLETDYYYSPSTPATNSVSVTFNTATDMKIIYVVVNKARMYRTRGSYTVADFEAELTDLAENSLTGFVMVGRTDLLVTEFDKNKNPNQAAQAVNVWVKRQVAMVKLSAITVDFSHSSLAGANFTLTGMYLKNAVGRSRLGLNGNTDSAAAAASFLPLTQAQFSNGDFWYNKHTRTSGSPALLYDDACNDACSTANESSSIGRCLFTYPNRTLPSADSHSDAATWVPRLTRLTIKAHVSKNSNGVVLDQDTFYTFDLPAVEANKVYNIQNIRITQMGKDNDDKDTDLQGGQIAPTISVAPWDSDVFNLNYEF